MSEPRVRRHPIDWIDGLLAASTGPNDPKNKWRRPHKERPVLRLIITGESASNLKLDKTLWDDHPEQQESMLRSIDRRYQQTNHSRQMLLTQLGATGLLLAGAAAGNGVDAIFFKVPATISILSVVLLLTPALKEWKRSKKTPDGDSILEKAEEATWDDFTYTSRRQEHRQWLMQVERRFLDIALKSAAVAMAIAWI